MRKLFSISMLVAGALMQNACAPVIIQQPNGVTYSNLSLQQRVIVTVQNNCAPFLKIQAGSVVYSNALPYGESVIAPLVRQPFTSGEFVLMVKGYNDAMRLVGTDTRHYSISSYDGEKNEVWEVDHLNLPNGKGGCIK